MMKVAFVHYHFRRGGVTSVVSNAVRSLTPLGVECVAICGEATDVMMPCPLRQVQELGYRSDLSGQEPDEQALFEALIAAGCDAFDGSDPDIWHIHNHSLGKNAVFAALVNRMVRSGRKVLLQIHDFAEDGRPSNYRVAKECGSALYPCGNNVAYAVLNARDSEIMKKAGAAAHILPNPVPEPQANNGYDPDRALPQFEQLYLYPTRGIRRKNIGETALYAAIAPKGAGVATTLAPQNPEWLPIHRNWGQFAKEHSLPLVLGASDDGADYAAMCQRAEAWITSSVAEGFGLAFLEPWAIDKPLIGRNLPAITSDFVLEGLNLSNMYDALRVPVDSLDMAAFKSRLSHSMKRFREAYGKSFSTQMLEEALSSWVLDDGIDFGVLDEHAQMESIEAVLASPALGEALANTAYRMPDAGVVTANHRVVAERYNMDAYGRLLLSLYEQLLAGQGTTGDAERIDENIILDEFLSPKVFRMLRS